MASKQDSVSLVAGRPSVYAGIQLAPQRKGDDGACTVSEKEIQIDFKKPFQDALQNVFDQCGKVVLAFPYSTRAQVKGHADYIRNAVPTSHYKQEQPQAGRTTTCFSMCSRGTERDADCDDSKFPDIDVELVVVNISGPLFMTVLEMIDSIIRTFRNLPNPRNPTVDVVMLRDPSETQALTIRTGEVEPGQVYFETFNREVLDPYAFFRVQFFSTQSGHERDFVTIWISIKTLLPIGITTNDELFAVLPQSTIDPAVPQSTSIESPTAITDDTDPFPWLQEIVLHHPNEYFFREVTMAADVIVIHPANATIDRRVTRQEEIAVVANNSQWEFNVLKFPRI